MVLDRVPTGRTERSKPVLPAIWGGMDDPSTGPPHPGDVRSRQAWHRGRALATSAGHPGCDLAIQYSIWLVPRLFSLRPLHFGWTSRSGRCGDERRTPPTGGMAANTAASSLPTVTPC